jgi:nucleoid-associated protein YgaU
VSLRRLSVTMAAMAAFAVALAALSPRPAELVAALTAPQATADGSGPDTVVLACCAALAWLAWSWGALGLALTAVSAVPGVLGALALAALRPLLPAGARRAAALALGLGLGMGAPWPASATPSTSSPDAENPVPDWPIAGDRADPVPDGPAQPAGTHVVIWGDCLWDIAEARLARASGRPPTDRQVLDAVHAWWSTNSAVIGPDPDLLFPGQVLRPPNSP